jgi:hypothetical protein
MADWLTPERRSEPPPREKPLPRSPAEEGQPAPLVIEPQPGRQRGLALLFAILTVLSLVPIGYMVGKALRNKGSPQGMLVGTWECAELGVLLRVKGDGTFSLMGVALDDQGSYRILDEDTLEITSEHFQGRTTHRMRFRITNDELRLRDEDGAEMTFRRQR